MKRLKIIGHRGAMGLAPENSIDAIRIAMKHSVHEIELDARLQQGAVVLSHDPTVPQEVYCPIQQALHEIDGKVPIVFDIKEAQTVKTLIKSLNKYQGQVIFSSHRYKILQKVKQLKPDAELAVIEKWSGVRAVAEASLLETKRIHINHNWLWSKFVQSMTGEGYKLYAYTVNDKKRAKELSKWGVVGVFTDYPDIFS